jgi:hypothetical protein
MKGGATYRFTSETEMLAWSGCPQPFPSRRDREFESGSLQRRVERTGEIDDTLTSRSPVSLREPLRNDARRQESDIPSNDSR